MATTGDEASAVLQTRDYSTFLFADLVMPGKLSGHNLAQHVAQQNPGVWVLMNSSFSESVLQGGKIGAEFAILRKPYRQADLAAALQAVFKDR